MESTDSTIAEGTHLKGLSPHPAPDLDAALGLNGLMDLPLRSGQGINAAVETVDLVMRDLIRRGAVDTALELVHTPLKSHAYSREAHIRRQAFLTAAREAKERVTVESFMSSTGARDEVRIPGVLDRGALVQPVRLNNEQWSMGQLTADQHREKIIALQIDIAGRVESVEIHQELLRIIEAAGVRCADDLTAVAVPPAEDD